MTHDRKVRDHFSSFHNYPEGIKPSFLTLEESKAETLNSLTEDLKPRGGEFELWPRGLVGSDVLPVPRALLPHEHQRYTVWTTGSCCCNGQDHVLEGWLPKGMCSLSCAKKRTCRALLGVRGLSSGKR